MNYIILDLEWNQPFNFEKMIKTPVMLYGEVIQIGAVKLDEDYHLLDTFKIMVLPQYYRKMHKKVSRLTGITTEELQYGFPFRIAFEYFQKWCGENFVFLTWGDNDIGMLRDNMRLYELDAEWLPNAYNLQVIFDDQITKEARQVSLAYAMEKIGKPALEAHDALHDARNAACICLHINMNKGLDEYNELQKQIKQREKIPVQQNRSVRLYETREAALADEEVIRFKCPVCKADIVCTDLVKQKTDKYICIARCEKEHEIFIRFRFRKIADCKFRVNRMLYNIDEEIRAYYLMKKQAVEDRRKRFIEMQNEAEII